MAGRLPESNSNAVTVTDRAAIGPQPDNTPATGGTPTGGGGGGTPTGPAGGDLAGTYPNPALAAIGGGAIGPIGDGTHVPVVTRDAKGRVTALTSTPITGAPPTGAAGGDLTGTFPNPTLAAIGAATGPIGDATHVARVTIDAKGRVTALTSVAISGGGGSGTVTSVGTGTGLTGGPITTSGTISLTNTAVTAGAYGNNDRVGAFQVDAQGRLVAAADLLIGAAGSRAGEVIRYLGQRVDDIFNVKDYGAVGDGTTNDGTAIAAAIAALQAFSALKTRGTLYFPDGTYLVSSAIVVALTVEFTCTIKGDGRFSSIILQTGSGVNGLTVNITPSSSLPAARVEVCDLSFHTNTNVQAKGIHINYGGSAVNSCEFLNGSIVQRCDFNTQQFAGGGGGGWTDAIYFSNPWKAHVFDCGGFGSSPGGLVPTSGAGSGAFLTVEGGQNINIANLNFSFFQRGLAFKAGASGSAGVAGIIANNVIMVAVGEGVHVYPQAFVSTCTFDGFVIDQGNGANAGYANVGFYFDCTGNTAGGGQFVVTASHILQISGSTACFIFKGPCTQNIVSNCVCFAAPLFAHLFTGVTNTIFSDNQFGGAGITLDSGANNNQANNTGGSTWSDSGTGNTHITTLF